VHADDDSNPAGFRRLDYVSAQEQEVLDVEDVRTHLVEIALELPSDLGIDDVKGEVGTDRDAERLARLSVQRPRLAGRNMAAGREDERLVPELRDPASHALGLKLRAGLLLGRKPVDDIENAH
jgi:hypothetical protein